ncbi:MAG TPA: hypothetical protein VNF29_14540 [Candidatus Binataceae bacterium]|nr:hypothetical protein [Candidatus Binataceae bacterium]
MNATTTNRSNFALTTATDTDAPADYLRYAQNSFLTELPGVVFGFVTLAYIIGSFLALA